MKVGTSPIQYALQMYNSIERLDQLGHWMDPELGIDLILARLSNSFAQFVLDYEMVHKTPTIPELINVLEMAVGKKLRRKAKRLPQKRHPQRVFASIVVKMAIGRGIARPT